MAESEEDRERPSPFERRPKLRRSLSAEVLSEEHARRTGMLEFKVPEPVSAPAPEPSLFGSTDTLNNEAPMDESNDEDTDSRTVWERPRRRKASKRKQTSPAMEDQDEPVKQARSRDARRSVPKLVPLAAVPSTSRQTAVKAPVSADPPGKGPERPRSHSEVSKEQSGPSQNRLSSQGQEASYTEPPVSPSDIAELMNLAMALETGLSKVKNIEKSVKSSAELLISSIRSVGRRVNTVGFELPSNLRNPKKPPQCKNCTPPRLTREELRAILTSQDPDVMDAIAKDWQESAFTATKIVGHSIISERDSARALVLTESNPKDARILEDMRKHFPGLEAASDQLKKGSTLCLRNRDLVATYNSAGEAVPLSQTDDAPSKALLAALALEPMDASNPRRVQDLIGHCMSLMDVACKEKLQKLSVATPSDISIVTARKVLEICAFTFPLLTIDLCAKGHRPTERKLPAASTSTTIILKPGNRSFAEVLGGMQAKLDPSKQGVRVSRPQRTAEGLLRLRVTGASREATAGFAEAMGKESDLEYSLKQPSNLTAIIVRDLGEDISPKDLGNALKGLGFSADSINLNPFRKTRSGDSSCIVRIPSGERARALINKGAIQLGWFSCRLDELVKITQCLNCLSFDHTSAKCALPRSNGLRCLKCGGVDHIAKDCTVSPRCYSCKVDGHFATTTECPVYRAKVASLRKQRKNNV